MMQIMINPIEEEKIMYECRTAAVKRKRAIFQRLRDTLKRIRAARGLHCNVIVVKMNPDETLIPFKCSDLGRFLQQRFDEKHALAFEDKFMRDEDNYCDYNEEDYWGGY
jgi:hypothetical protein